MKIKWTTLLLGCGLTSCQNHMSTSLKSDSPVPSPCQAPDILQITRPYYSGTDSPNFTYKFVYNKSATPDAPVIIVLPGGPGGTSIDHRVKLPTGFGVIYTDPRGVGCNEGLYPDAFYSSDNLAADIIAIIDELNLKNYIIYGMSYGTALATVTVQKIEQTDLAKPSAVVLQGTLGRAWTSTDELFSGFVSQWNDVKTRIPAAAVTRLTTEDAPAGIPDAAWLEYIQSNLRVGSMFGQKNSLEMILPLLAHNKPSSDLILKDLIAPDQSSIGAGLAEGNLQNETQSEAPYDRVYRVIACSEFLPSPLGQMIYHRGVLSAEENEETTKYCEGIPINKFDSSSLRLTTPIFYIEGERDPATPSMQARYHFEHQKSAPRFYVEVPESGHAPLTFSLEDCSDLIWKSISDKGNGLTEALASCSVRPSYEKKNVDKVPREYLGRLIEEGAGRVKKN